MPIESLGQLLAQYINRKMAQVPQAAAGGTSAGGGLYRGRITRADGNSFTVSVTETGEVVEAKMYSDEILMTGAAVWVSPTSDGWLIHGGVK